MKAEYKQLFQNRNFTKDLAASIINRFGDSIDAIASSWIVYELTGEASWSAIIYAINRLPTIFLTPLAGPWVERHSKKGVMVAMDLIRAVCVGVLATGLLMGFLSAPLIAVLTLIISSAEAFRIPAGTAVFPHIVSENLYGEAMSLNQATSSITELVGTGVAAAIIAVIGSAGAIYVDMVTFLLSALLISTLHLPEDANHAAEGFSLAAYTQDLKEGFLYCASKKRLVLVTIMVLFLNGILVPMNSLKTPMVKEIFHGDAWFLSVFGMTLTICMLLGSVIFPMVQKKMTMKKNLVFICVGIAFFHLLLVAATPLYNNLWVGAAVLAVLSGVLGFVVGLGNMYLSVEMMRIIDRDYLARASSIGSALGSAIMPVTAALITLALQFTGVSEIFLAAGVAAILFCGVLLTRSGLDEEKQEAVISEAA